MVTYWNLSFNNKTFKLQGFFPRSVPHHHQNVQQQQPPLSLSYIYPANAFQFRPQPQPPHVLNSQPSAFSMPPPPPSLNQLHLQGLFPAPPFPTTSRQPQQQLTASNFAGRNVIFSSLSSSMNFKMNLIFNNNLSHPIFT